MKNCSCKYNNLDTMASTMLYFFLVKILLYAIAYKAVNVYKHLIFIFFTAVPCILVLSQLYRAS